MGMFKKEKNNQKNTDEEFLAGLKEAKEVIKEDIEPEENTDFNLFQKDDESFDKIVDMVRKKETETNIKTKELMEKSLIQNKEELKEIKKNKKDVEDMNKSLKKTYEVLKTREQLVSLNIQNAEKFFQQ